MRALYHYCDQLWQKTEKILSVFLMIFMTLITFIYTMVNNIYVFFYYLADNLGFAKDFWFKCGDLVLDLSNNMGWSLALTKASFAWLIFFMMSYGVRVGGHIGIDLIIKLFPSFTQKVLALIALSACLLYAGIMLYASLSWIWGFYKLQIEAEDLHQLHILKWHIAIIVPLGFLLIIFRYLEIAYRVLNNQQLGLGLADETKDALLLSSKDDILVDKINDKITNNLNASGGAK